MTTPREAQLLERIVDLEREVARRRAGLIEVACDYRQPEEVEKTGTARFGIFIWDAASEGLYWSDEMFRLVGMDPQTDVASMEGFFAAVHPDDRERVFAANAEVARTGKPKVMDYRMQHKDGTVLEVTAGGTVLLDEHGKMSRMVGAFVDLTSLRETQRRLASTVQVLESAQSLAKVGSYHWDLATGELEWSQELYAMLGVDRREAPSVEAFMSRIHPADRKRAEENLTNANRGAWAGVAELRLLLPNGELRHVLTDQRPLVHEGTVIGYSGLVVDLTEHRRLEQQLLHAQKMESIGRLAGGLAHDFNNYLAVIFAGLDLAERSPDPAHFAVMREAVTAAASLTRSLLTYSRRSELELSAVDLSQLVRKTLPMVERIMGGAELRSELATDLGQCMCDSGQLQQAILNLCINARDALHAEGRITIRTQNIARYDGAARVCLAVEDNGVGMDSDTLGKIFEPFFSTKSAQHGTGIGLSMVYGIVKSAGGEIEVDSLPGHGTTFRLLFPSVATTNGQSAHG